MKDTLLEPSDGGWREAEIEVSIRFVLPLLVNLIALIKRLMRI
jgi:hypothetical protein